MLLLCLDVPSGIWFSIEVGDTEEFASVLPLTLQASVRHNRWRKMPSNLSPDKTKIECLWRDYGITPISCNITLFKNPSKIRIFSVEITTMMPLFYRLERWNHHHLAIKKFIYKPSKCTKMVRIVHLGKKELTQHLLLL